MVVTRMILNICSFPDVIGRFRHTRQGLRRAGTALTVLLFLAQLMAGQPASANPQGQPQPVSDTLTVAVMHLQMAPGCTREQRETFSHAHRQLHRRLVSIDRLHVLPDEMLEEFHSSCSNFDARAMASTLGCEVAEELMQLLPADLLVGGIIGQDAKTTTFELIVRDGGVREQCASGNDSPRPVFTGDSPSAVFDQAAAWLRIRVDSLQTYSCIWVRWSFAHGLSLYARQDFDMAAFELSGSSYYYLDYEELRLYKARSWWD
jgi:hypothetical protein